MKELPLGIQDFESLISNNFLYIDKTQYIYNLARIKRYYFLARPRRFGKSLLCSTLQALFEGKKELFKGLWIEKSPWEWKEYPVITLNFGTLAHSTPEQIEVALKDRLALIAKKNNLQFDKTMLLFTSFRILLEELYKKAPVVIIIDEYDKPIIDHLDDLPAAHKVHKYLRSFYELIKNLDHYLRFVLLTGITKFSKTSIFSGLNNLFDITISEEASVLLGYTQEEVEKYISPYLQNIANQQNSTLPKIQAELKKWYNGYQFFENAPKVYNPYSVLEYLSTKKFSNYWFTTGTPSFLIKLFKKNNYPVYNLEKTILFDEDLVSFDLEYIDLNILLFQTGYLTIIDYDPDARCYTLSCPNYEVSQSLYHTLAQFMTRHAQTKLRPTLYLLKQS